MLDEAQFLKNPQSKAAQVARALHSEHRLCLTGTPVENHLGDLWSLFAIALPGLLGDRATFGRIVRTPIEKRGDLERRRAPAERTRPFLLRRTKENVVSELSEKTEIVRRVELSGKQRDLYETVRIAMHERVQQEIERSGIARSHIVILDALLKLRQVCCDPRLLPERFARSVSSIKLDLLVEIVPEMIEEGRRILLFSQFTSMLDLIVPELEKLDIPYAMLTGKTTDRAAQVQRFESGDVPLFLISLKAGGTGQYRIRRIDDPHTVERLKAIAAERRRFGYRRLGLMLRRERIVANQKRVYRIYRDLALQLRPRRKRGVRYVRGNDVPAVTTLYERWSIDFVHDRLSTGRAFRVLTVVDDFSRECIALEVDFWFPENALRGFLTALHSLDHYRRPSNPTTVRSLQVVSC